MAAFVLFFLSFFGNRAYQYYLDNGCGISGCAISVNEEVNSIKMEIGKKVVATNQEIIINELLYKLYVLPDTKEYVLVGWKSIKDKGLSIRDIVQGMEEKELVPTNIKGEYLFVWGDLQETIHLFDNETLIQTYQKEKKEYQLNRVKLDNQTNVSFETKK